jgi:D-alanine-D-alanine ligase
MKKLKIAVLYGGPSSEREISLVTGKAIFENLDRKKYQPSLIEMTKDNQFVLLNKNKRKVDFIGKDRKTFDMVFIALHGTPGEDGTIQGMFDILGIKYTGPNTLSSALCMNKVYTGLTYYSWHLPHPPFIDITAKNWKKHQSDVLKAINSSVGYPCVIKPVDQGSAVGVSIAKTEDELKKMVGKSLKQFSWLMAQKFIKGQEATCGVLEKNDEPLALPPTHILPQAGKFYDYKSKYAAGGSKHICPADFPPEINKQMQAMALTAHKALGCRGMSRTDLFFGDDGQVYIIETNTIPGMTSTSLFPEAAMKAGISFSKMLDLIIKASL